MAIFQVQIEVSPRPDISRVIVISTSKDYLKRDLSRELSRSTDDSLSVAAAIERFDRDGLFAYCVCQLRLSKFRAICHLRPLCFWRGCGHNF
jgi:hypothetical protein